MDDSSTSPIGAAAKRKRKRSSSDEYKEDTPPERSSRSSRRRINIKQASGSSNIYESVTTHRVSSVVLETIEFDSFPDPLEHLKPPFYQFWDARMGSVSLQGDGTPSRFTSAIPVSASTTSISPAEVEGGGEEAIMYFAYGIDMSSVYMEDRFPGAEMVGIGILKGGAGFRWCIGDRGYPLVLRCRSHPVEVSHGLVTETQNDKFQGEVHGVVFMITGRKHRGILDAECEMRGGCTIEEVNADVKVRVEHVEHNDAVKNQIGSPVDGHAETTIEDAYGVRRQLKSDVKVWILIGPENEQQGISNTAAFGHVDAKYDHLPKTYSRENEPQIATNVEIETKMVRPMEILNREMNRAIFEALQEGLDREYVEHVMRRVVAYPKESVFHPFS